MAPVPHTPTPWRVSRGDLIRIHAGPVTIAGVHKIGRVEPLALANANFLARAVNNHDRMLAALKAALGPLDQARHGPVGGLAASTAWMLAHDAIRCAESADG